MEQKSKNYKSTLEIIKKNKKNVNYIFLGVGLTLFVLNLSSFISFVNKVYQYTTFDISVFGAMIIILLAVYNIHNTK